MAQVPKLTEEHESKEPTAGVRFTERVDGSPRGQGKWVQKERTINGKRERRIKIFNSKVKKKGES